VKGGGQEVTLYCGRGSRGGSGGGGSSKYFVTTGVIETKFDWISAGDQ